MLLIINDNTEKKRKRLFSETRRNHVSSFSPLVVSGYGRASPIAASLEC